MNAKCPLCKVTRRIRDESIMVTHPGDVVRRYPVHWVFRCELCGLTVEQPGVCGSVDLKQNQAALNRLIKRLDI
jgi:hypothetical protein